MEPDWTGNDRFPFVLCSNLERCGTTSLSTVWQRGNVRSPDWSKS